MRVGREVQRLVVGVVVALAVAALPVATSAPPAAAGPVADGLADRLLTVRPAVGPTWVLDVGGTTGERVLARFAGRIETALAEMQGKKG